jgi:threonine synthase
MLRYISTRGAAPGLGFADATLTGLAADGGLYVPEACPKISSEELDNMAAQNYLEIAWRVILPFVSDDISSDALIAMLRRAYKGFSHKEIAPLHRLEDNLYVQELFHGPTLAFKDIALQFLAQVFDAQLEKRNSRATIVGATSGDTGSAAIEAFRGRGNVDIFILHPKGRVSDVQRRQMTTVIAPNVFNIAVEGSFDDCQDIVKALFNDKDFREDVRLSAVNSINWARILAQVVYYVYAGARLKAKTGRPVAFCVPTGNFGNIYAGYIARSMGVPVEKLLIASNRNDILHRFMTTGKMQAEAVAPSLSPSMDIQISSNFERLLFDLYGRKGDMVARTMAHFRTTGPYRLEEPVMEQLRGVFGSGRVDDEGTLDVMKNIYRKYDYPVDPHTAVGLGVAQDYLARHPDAAVVSLATAHPAKFPAAVTRAIGHEPELPAPLADLLTREEKFTVLPADVARVRDFVRQGVRRS